MDLKDLLSSEAEQVFLNGYFFGQEISYTPNGGAATTINAVVELGETLRQEQDDRGQKTVKTATLLVLAGSFAVGDEFTFDGITWKLEGSSKTNNDGTQVLEVVSIEDVEVGTKRRTH